MNNLVKLLDLFNLNNSSMFQVIYLDYVIKLFNTFHHQLLMTQNFTAFHNAHNGGINSLSYIIANIFL